MVTSSERIKNLDRSGVDDGNLRETIRMTMVKYFKKALLFGEYYEYVPGKEKHKIVWFCICFIVYII